VNNTELLLIVFSKILDVVSELSHTSTGMEFVHLKIFRVLCSCSVWINFLHNIPWKTNAYIYCERPSWDTIL